jgi:signal transduction histidine kinase/ligand-binding sensor domain-containing protein/ActR/RegA family two-component response regulator
MIPSPTPAEPAARSAGRRVLALLAGLAFAAGGTARAAEAGAASSGRIDADFLQRVWETADGLMPTYVPAIAQTTDGYVWLAVFDNVVRFDGVRAKPFSGRQVPGVLPAPVRGEFAHGDRAGRLWLGNSEGRLFSMKNSVWREVTEAEGWTPLRVTGASEAPDGRILFRGKDRLVVLEGRKFAEVAPPPQRKSAKSPTMHAVFDTAGRLHGATSSGLWRYADEKWTQLFDNQAAGWNPAGMARSATGGVWLAGPNEIRLLDPAGTVVRTIDRPADFIGGALELLEDSRGNLWAGGFRDGLTIWMADGRMLRPEHDREALRPQVNCLLEDREHNVLVGTAGAGLARFKPQDFLLPLGHLGSLAGSQVNCVIEFAPGRMLAGTEGNGLFVIERSEAKSRIVSADGDLGTRQRVSSLLSLGDGTALAAVSSKGIFRITGDEALKIPSPKPVTDLVRAMFRDSKGTVWLGCERGIFTWQDGKFSPVAAAAQSERVWGIAEDATGDMWFVTKAGLMRLRASGALEQVPIAGVSATANVLGLIRASGGGVWVGVENAGLIRLRDGAAPLILAAAQGLPIASIGGMIEDAGALWLAGEKGLVRVEVESIEGVASGKLARLQLHVFNRGDGLASDIFRRSYQPVVARGKDGRLWFATHKGVASLDPQKFTRPEREVPAIIEEIRAERELITVTPQNRGNISIPAGTKHMTIRCSMPSLSKPEFVEFEYQLEGMDSRWYSSGTERVIRFYDVPPGDYRFLVRAIGSDGRPVEPVDAVTMRMLPFYWQTKWFRMLVLAAGVVLVAIVARFGIRRRLARQELLLAQQEERARLELELQQTKRSEVIGRLAGGIAHDFNNILVAVLGNAELARLEYGQQNPDLRNMLDSILSAGERARELIVQILTYSRQRKTELVPLDIAPVLREALMLLRSGTPATVEFVTDIPHRLPLVLADATEVQRILMNLGTNAVQAMGPAGGRVTISAREVSGGEEAHPEIPPGKSICLRVEDNGAGMDNETLQQIFDPFFTTKGLGKGSGLGLSVVKGIIESLHGVIVVDSKPDAGTTFRVFFPVTTGSAIQRIERPAPVVSDHAERIFLVDDEPQVLSVGRRLLESLGYEVSAHGSSLAALEAFAADPKRWQLVITDFAMPGMNGVELARRIRARRADIPILLCTGFGGAVDTAAAKSVGIARVINKPFQRAELSEAVAGMLGKTAVAAK